jgi:hypothetical protein
MKIKQLSMFMENKPGHLIVPTRVLKEAEINILTLSMADTQQFGIFRIIVREWEKAKEVLESAGVIVKVTDVIATDLVDRPGGLLEVLEIVNEAEINIEYMYAFNSREADKAALVLRFDDPDIGIEALKAKGIPVLGPDELFGRVP